ncbi:MAG: hypothetical protein JSR78_13040 [Proteobacteria bacterium]|nr:hypothetical protein [Pseudomonadota bacterium]
MAKLGIIHVGLPKTGTSTIQSALYENRQRLLSDHAMLYPGIAHNHTDSLHTMFAADPREHIQIMCQGTADDAEITRVQHRNRFEAFIENARQDWNTLIISAEGLSNFNPRQLASVKEWTSQYVDQWKILFWARHPIHFTTSNVQQMIRGGRTLESLRIKEAMPNFRGRLENLIQVFGKEAIDIQAFEKASQGNGGLVAAFCRQLGLDEHSTKVISSGAPVKNQSMSYVATMAINRLNLLRPLFIDGILNPTRTPDDANVLSRLPGPRFHLSPDMIEAVRSASCEDVRWLNRNFNLNLYTDILQTNAKCDERTADIPVEAIDALVIAISDLIRSVKAAEETARTFRQSKISRKIRNWMNYLFGRTIFDASRLRSDRLYAETGFELSTRPAPRVSSPPAP